MRLLLDTSVLVAGLLIAHPRHAASRGWLGGDTARADQRVVCAHALAETWSVLTRMPVLPRVTPAAAETMLRRLASRLEVVAVTDELELAAIRRCAERGLSGGAVHDALHLVTAEASRADAVVTWNERDFERLSEPTSPRIVVPSHDLL